MEFTRNDPAGAGFGELGLQDLRQSRSASAKVSSGYVCTLTLECNC